MATELDQQPRATYVWRALDAEGRETGGMMAAASAQEVARRLRGEGRTVLSVKRDEAIAANGRNDAVTRAGRARRSDLSLLCRHIGTMAEAGVPITEALEAACTDGARPEFRPFVEALARDVEQGMSLSQAFARRGRDVPAIVVALSRAAESTGQTGPMLLRASEHLQRHDRLVRQLRAAASYPMFMLGTGGLIVVALLVFVLPRFAKIYAERGAELPLPTKMLLATSELVRGHAPAIGFALAALATAGWLFFRSGRGSMLVDRARFGAPILGKVARTAFVAVACRTLATLLASGIHLLDAIAICRGLVRSPRAEAFWTAVDAKLRDGSSLVEALKAETLLPASVVSMVAAGERSGRLPEVLSRAADFAEEDLETSLKQATALLEPVLVVVFGAVLGLMAIAILLPLFSVAKVAAG
ncbi:MAG: type II secretion system F family protein [Planctomycetota bacterium]